MLGPEKSQKKPDGDSINVLHDWKEVEIRLHGVDTPEKK